MGRPLLVVLAAAVVAGCVHEPAPPAAELDAPMLATATASDPHGELPCTACHTGALTGDRVAAVPRQTCAASGCHEDGGPSHVSTKTATFRHLDHGQTSDVALSCAGCHTHDAGREPLRVSLDGCALCHLGDIHGGQPSDCRLCHQQPQHVALTSQALPIPHSSLPWVETGCVRCHYDVAEPLTRVTMSRCTSCHGRDTTVIARGIATDLHPSHTAVSCAACHEGDAHRVRAMSSAVQLVCGDCHVREHDISLGSEWRDDATCSACHEAVHQPQQRLLLGLLPGEPATPSTKFIAGMTCRSCHIRTEGSVAGGAAGNPIRGQADACSSCHQTEYRRVLDWWLDGTRTRTRTVSAYVAQAAADLRAVDSDSVRALIGSSQALVELVAEAGGHHNLELSDRIFRQSVERVRRAYALAGRVPPQPPTLGSPAHEGMCSYCHYSATEPWDFRRMTGPFHQSLPGLQR
jgi:hypothetical protein